MAYAKIYGQVECAGMQIFKSDRTTNETLISSLKSEQTKVSSPLTWTVDTVMISNMKNQADMNGGTSMGNLSGLDHYLVYKTIGDSDKLYKVYETQSASQKIIEDFAVGNKCGYQYYIYPVLKKDGKYQIAYPMTSEKLFFDKSYVIVAGLIQSENDEKVYEFDLDNIWGFKLNATDSGLSQTIDKTFYTNQSMYSKMSGGNNAALTKTVKGLLGKIDCETKEYSDTYDYIKDWMVFARSNSLKVLIDIRGFIIPCDIKNNSISYMEQSFNAEASFDIEQLTDLDNIEIHARPLLSNFATGEQLLADVNGSILRDSNGKYLIVQGGEL